MAQLPSWGKSVIRIVVILSIFYGIVLLALFIGQRQLLFYPAKGTMTGAGYAWQFWMGCGSGFARPSNPEMAPLVSAFLADPFSMQ